MKAVTCVIIETINTYPSVSARTRKTLVQVYFTKIPFETGLASTDNLVCSIHNVADSSVQTWVVRGFALRIYHNFILTMFSRIVRGAGAHILAESRGFALSVIFTERRYLFARIAKVYLTIFTGVSWMTGACVTCLVIDAGALVEARLIKANVNAFLLISRCTYR